MDKNQSAIVPPMGWNSYDYYDTTVSEEEIRSNADFMAANLKKFGWEYIVVDIQWYAYGAGSKRDSYQYIPFSRLEMDEYGRLLPCPERFPSSAGGLGFKPLADYVHQLGLKFGIHIMRGIPRIAAHQHCPILGSNQTADQVADPSSICGWNPDMYGLRGDLEGSYAYYFSLVSLYADWGVDFIKCDDICNTNLYPHKPYSARKEIEMLSKAIGESNRPIVLSLSPGPALIEEAWHYEKHANMWRITDDFWDDWKLLLNMFHRCELWQNHVSKGCYPDCDMLPLGQLGKGFGKERPTHFTLDEQKTMMTLWCMFRSPLMLGAELTKLDKQTLSLITNEKVLSLLEEGRKGIQLKRDEHQAVWVSKPAGYSEERKGYYIALFNFEEKASEICFSLEEVASILELPSEWMKTMPPETAQNHTIVLTELWTGEKTAAGGGQIKAVAARHGVCLFELTSEEGLWNN